MSSELIRAFETEHNLLEEEEKFRRGNISISLAVRAMEASPEDRAGVVVALCVTQARRVFPLMYHVIMNLKTELQFEFVHRPVEITVNITRMLLQQRWNPTVHSFLRRDKMRTTFHPFGINGVGRHFFLAMEEYREQGAFKLMFDWRLFLLIPQMSYDMPVIDSKYGWTQKFGHGQMHLANQLYDRYRHGFVFAFLIQMIMDERDRWRRELLYSFFLSLITNLAPSTNLVREFQSLGEKLENNFGTEIVKVFERLCGHGT